MAASLSRPDPSSPASVAEAGFSTSRRGFSQDEVRAFLTSVAAELGRLQERERQLEAQLRDAEAEVDVASTSELDEETVAALLGEETLRVLQTARESASQIKIRAEESAAKILNEANDEVNRLRQEAEVEAARKRHDASSDAEAEVALAKQQGREMVTEARAYRERVLADLERRTKLARQQIDDLLHGRDRLLQVFERARLVAVDVTSELQSIDGPAEFVNFSPTTGPLPLMVPAGELERDRPAGAGTATDPVDLDASEKASDEFDFAHTDDADEADANDADVDDVDADDTVALDADHDAAHDGDTDGAVEGPVADAAAPRDANVVSLFRDRSDGPHEADTTIDHADDEREDDERQNEAVSENEEMSENEAVSENEEMSENEAVSENDEVSEADERPDVGGIFERLRSESPALAETDDEPDDIAEPDAESADPDGADEPTPFSRRDAALVPLIVGGARKLKRVLADEQNGVLDRLRQKQSVTQLDQLVADPDDHVAIYVGALADDLLGAAVAGAAEVGKRDSKTLRTTLAKGGALDRAHAVVRDDLVGPLRARLERAISDGGGDNEDITKRVRAVYREWKTQHIDDQLDDAFRFAHGGGLAAGVKPGTMLSWIIDPSESTCPDCEDNSLAGEVASGDAFPTGHTAAPAHAGCRCLTVPSAQ